MMRSKTGQVTLEYFLLLAAIIVVTLIGASTVHFHTDIAEIFRVKLFKAAVDHMPLDDGGPVDPPSSGVDPGGPGGPGDGGRTNPPVD